MDPKIRTLAQLRTSKEEHNNYKRASSCVFFFFFLRIGFSKEIGGDCCYFSRLIGHFHMEDDEFVDPKKYLEEGCKPKCVKSLLEYQACFKRIEGDESGHKHCTGQYFDYWSCVDKCVAPKLFSKVK